MTAKIEERGEIAAKLAAAAAYTPFILRVMITTNDLSWGQCQDKDDVGLTDYLLQDFGADPGEACIKSQDYISR